MALIGIVVLAGGLQGWLLRQTNVLVRGLSIIAGLVLVYPKAMFDFIGMVLFAAALASQKLRRPANPAVA